MDNVSKRWIYKLLYPALIEIRDEASVKEYDKIRRLSDLMHNIPSRIALVQKEPDYTEILEKIKRMADT